VVAGHEANGRMLERVAEVYKWLELQISSVGGMAGDCRSCGDCCDFEGFDHRLFVTLPELVYLEANLGAEGIKPMPSSRCPYNINDRCTVYEYRFSGCRIFCCNGNVDFQSWLSEETLKRLRSICTEFQIPYHYTELAAALNNLAGI